MSSNGVTYRHRYKWLSSQSILKPILSADYVVYRDWLYEVELIDYDRRASREHTKCYYSLHSDFDGEPMVSFPIKIYGSTAKYYTEHFDKGLASSRSNDIVNFDSVHILEDALLQHATQCLELSYNNLKDNEVSFKKIRGESLKVNAYEYYRDFIISNQMSFIHSLLEDGWRPNRDSYGRAHSKLTILRKDFRKFLVGANNEQLVSIDIKSSQPYFLYAFLKKSIGENKAQLDSFDKDIHHKLEEELADYFCLLEDGIYEWVINSWKSTITRGEAKVLCFQYFYGYDDLNQEEVSKESIFEIFEARFPTIHGYINVLKGVSFERQLRRAKDFVPSQISSTFEKHKILAQEMQKMESKVVIDIVCKKLRELYPSITVAPIHDCILTEKSNLEKVKKVFEGVLKDEGISAPLVEEFYRDPNDKTLEVPIYDMNPKSEDGGLFKCIGHQSVKMTS